MSSWAKGSALAAALWAAACSSALAQKKDADASDAFFKTGQIPRLVIEIDAAAADKLREEPRQWVQGKLRENDRNVYEDVSFKLKGAAGSFREFDDLPSFTVRMDKVDDDQKFHDLRKFHLNKSPQDETYLQEFLGGELFRAAGVLAPRVTHARVWVGKRDMGVYALKEGFDTALIKRGFEKASGNLYDGGFCQDIDAELELDEGKGNDRADIKKLLEACRETDLVKRWARVEQLVDIKSFITVMTMELMLGHWDGYCQNRNNYRIYFEPASRKAFFLPHGMDQLFGDADASILDNPMAIVADAVMKNPAWRADFRKKIAELLPLFNSDRLKKRIDELAKRLGPVIQGWNRDQSQNHEAAVLGLKERVEAREKSLKEQKVMPDPKPLVFSPDVPVRLTRWRTNSECEDAALVTEKASGVELMRITAGKSGVCIASYRRSVLLGKGKYRFHAFVAVKDVEPLETEKGGQNNGGGLRIGGAKRETQLLGSADFKSVTFEFEITEEARDVELIAELRASKGQIAFRSDSLTLTKLSK